MNYDITHLEKYIQNNFDRNWEIGVSTLTYPQDPVKAIKELASSGLNVHRIELGLGRRVKFGNYIGKLLKLKEEHGLKFSVHVPFLYDDLAHPHPEIRETIVSEAKKSIQLADLIGSDWVVVHPGGIFLDQTLPEVPELEPLKDPRETYLDNSRSSIARLGDYSASRDITLCVENLPYGLGWNRKEIENLIAHSENTKFILDIGHANVANSLWDLLALNPLHFHFHDNEGSQDRHLKLGAGNIELKNVVKSMIENGGDKIIVLELYTLSDIKESINHLTGLIKNMR